MRPIPASTLVGVRPLVTAGAVRVEEVQRIVPRLDLDLLGRRAQVGAVRIGSGVPTSL